MQTPGFHKASDICLPTDQPPCKYSARTNDYTSCHSIGLINSKLAEEGNDKQVGHLNFVYDFEYQIDLEVVSIL